MSPILNSTKPYIKPYIETQSVCFWQVEILLHWIRLVNFFRFIYLYLAVIKERSVYLLQIWISLSGSACCSCRPLTSFSLSILNLDLIIQLYCFRLYYNNKIETLTLFLSITVKVHSCVHLTSGGG